MNPDLDGFFTEHFPPPEVIARDIDEAGFKVYRNAIQPAQLQALRGFWLDYFSRVKSSARATERVTERVTVRGGLVLGERNFSSYSNTDFWNLYREFDFLWNPATDPRTRALSLAIHEQRNLAQKFAPGYGLELNPERYGIYISTSLYPVGKGFLKAHADGHQATPILHYMLPLTHRGVDYTEGGFYTEQPDGQKVDLEAQMDPGSIVFFDGRLKHGVDRILGPANSPGRIATFAIPTFFILPSQVPRGFAAFHANAKTWLKKWLRKSDY